MLDYEKGAPPLYSQLERLMKSHIEHGVYNKGDAFPTEKMLMEQYHVSRVTVRQAYAALAQAGYIKSSRGIGTVVTYEKIEEQLKSVISFTEEMRRHNIVMKTSYCKIELTKPGLQAAMALGTARTEECYRLTRVRCVEEKPLVYTVTWLKKKAVLPMDSSYYMESLYQYLRDNHGIRIERGVDTLEASLPTQEVCNYLEIEPTMPVFKRVRQTYLPENEIYEYSHCYYPGNRYKYTVNL